jgi:hypothetical protein
MSATLLQVSGNILWRGAMTARSCVKLTETIVRQPAINQMPGQPCPPLALHRHARIATRMLKPASSRKSSAYIPIIQPILQRQLQHGTADEHGGDEPGC